MNVHFEVPVDLESVLRHRAAAEGLDIASFLRQVLTENLLEEEEVTRPSASPNEFGPRLAAWIALHPVLDHVVDDSREAIYAGRGE